MLSDVPKSVYLKDYKEPEFTIDTVDLHFDLNEEFTRVKSTLKIIRSVKTAVSAPLELLGEDLTLESIFVNDKQLKADDFRVAPGSLTIFKMEEKATIVITTTIKPQENTKLEGLYKSSGNFCTQCEAEGFRRITYYLDRPDVMAKFTTTIVGDKDKYPVLLSNGNPIKSGDLPGGKHFMTWEDPFRKPSYLFALVAGTLLYVEDFFTTMSGRKVQIRIYVEKENIDQCQHAMNSVIKSMQWDETRFGREYDLDYFNIVAVNDFNMGAMENKGLNIFNSKYILAKPETATDIDYLWIESVIGHEYFHNWSGNRITCRDWFQLSLKEGLTVFRDQEFTSDMQSRSVTRIGNVNDLRNTQFPQDNGPMAHPVRPEEYEEINNFYTTTIYNKGAEVIRMMFTILGKAKFRSGLDLYFSRHDGQAVTTEDFVKCMQDSSGVDLSQFKYWYSQAGTPVVTVDVEYNTNGTELTLNFKQTCPPTPGQNEKMPFHIPIKLGLVGENGKDVKLQFEGNATLSDGNSIIFNLTEKTQSLKLKNLKGKTIPSMLREFSAPIKLNYEYTDSDLAYLMANDSDDFTRWEAGQIYSMRLILRNITAFHRGDTLFSDEDFLSSFENLLMDNFLEGSYKSLAMSLPSENYVSELMGSIDIEGVNAARKYLVESVAKRFRNQLLALYVKSDVKDTYVFNKEGCAKRSLKNRALYYLMQIAGKEEIELCYKQFLNGSNMTDVITALSLLADVNCEQREKALDSFYLKWKHEPLVVNKWLGIHASSALPGTLDKVKSLMSHESFDLKNPNKVRALIGSFSFNRLQFHDPKGSGYAYLTDMIIKLDSMNPQVAARLVAGLINYKRFDRNRMDLMRNELLRLKNIDKISKDVGEIVSKSLH
jgi:aminopeptidase N